MRDTEIVAAHNIAFLEQGLAVISRVGAELYSAALPHFSRGGVGTHFRHILDHYDAFLSGLAEGRVDYDRRERDELTECDPTRALDRLRSVITGLRRIDHKSRERALSVAMDSGEREKNEDGWTATSVGRELQYLLAHTVHHYALIGAMLRSAGADPGPDFGVAPSTLRYERGDPLCAH